MPSPGRIPRAPPAHTPGEAGEDFRPDQLPSGAGSVHTHTPGRGGRATSELTSDARQGPCAPRRSLTPGPPEKDTEAGYGARTGLIITGAEAERGDTGPHR